jgi:hypothetical protein
MMFDLQANWPGRGYNMQPSVEQTPPSAAQAARVQAGALARALQGNHIDMEVAEVVLLAPERIYRAGGTRTRNDEHTPSINVL